MTYWACAIPEKLPAQQRLSQAIELAKQCGIPTGKVHVPPTAATGVTAPLGTEIVVSADVPRGQIRFERDGER